MTAQRTPRTAKMTTRLGSTPADDRSVKSALASKLNQLLDASGLSQAEAGELLGMPQPKISAIRNLKLTGISLERLLQALSALGQHVDIVVSPSRRGMPAGIRVDEQRRSKVLTARSVSRRE
jgi:predicted XRE-type DNA-binding protein